MGERKHSPETLRRALEQTIDALVSALEMRDSHSAGHQHRVSDLARAIAREMELCDDVTTSLCLAGLLHDIGKMSVPAEILNKASRLSETEMALVRDHPRAAYDILQDVEFPWPIIQIVLQHHERLDGSGYPQGLKGEEILLEARILAVADIVEAMASHRAHRPALGIGKALEEITCSKGILYDPEVVDACLKLFAQKGYELGEKMKYDAGG